MLEMMENHLMLSIAYGITLTLRKYRTETSDATKRRRQLLSISERVNRGVSYDVGIHLAGALDDWGRNL
jgi:hypothetical protein